MAAQNKLETMEALAGKVQDICHSQRALIEKLASLQIESTEKGMDSIADKLGKPFSSASKNGELLEELLSELELERNRLKNESEGAETEVSSSRGA